MTTGWKVDLILRRDRTYSRTEFDRRRAARIEGLDVEIAAPEDVILTKLEWAQLGESERQRRDVEAVVRMMGDLLDRGYLRTWAAQLGVADDLDKLLP